MQLTHLKYSFFQYLSITLISWLLCTNCYSQQTITSVRDGKWENLSTWNNGVPAPGDTVFIDCHNIEIDANTGNVVIERLEIFNNSNNNGGATLKIFDNVSVTVNDSIIATATNVGRPVDVIIADDAILNANTIFFNRSAMNTKNNRVLFEIRQNAVVNVNANFQYDYLGSGNEGSHEIDLNSDSRLIVGGDLIVNHTSGKKFQFMLVSNARLTVAGNVILNHSGGNNFQFDFNGSSSLFTGQDLTAMNNGGGDNPILIDFASNAFARIAGALTLTSAIAGDEIELELNGNVRDTLNSLYLNATGEGDILIDMNGDANLIVRDAITRNNGYGQLVMGVSTRITYAGSNSQVIAQDAGTGTDSFTYTNLEINNNGTQPLSLEGPVTINKMLILTNGIVASTSVNKITIDNGDTNGGNAGSYIDGPIRKLKGGTFIFPVGDGQTFAPLEVSTPGVAGDYTAQYFHTNYFDLVNTTSGIDHVSSNEYWTLDRTAGNDVYVTLHWKDGSSSVIDSIGDLIVAHYLGGQWIDEGNGGVSGGTGSNVAGSIRTLNKVSTFSPFTLASKSKYNPLPVELIAFSALVVNSTVELNWTTSSEIHNDYFTIERSQDGIRWESVITVDGAGYSNLIINYTAIDKHPIVGTSYYRITQTDFDNNSTTSDAIRINFDPKSKSAVTVYPNPTTDILNITTTESNLDGFMIFNMVGQNVTSMARIIDLTNSIISLDIREFPAGIYAVNTIGGSIKIYKH